MFKVKADKYLAYCQLLLSDGDLLHYSDSHVFVSRDLIFKLIDWLYWDKLQTFATCDGSSAYIVPKELFMSWLDHGQFAAWYSVHEKVVMRTPQPAKAR
jgi:hypothetical protein